MAGQGMGPLQLHPLPCLPSPQEWRKQQAPIQKALGAGLPTKAVFDQRDVEALIGQSRSRQWAVWRWPGACARGSGPFC